MQPNSGLNEIFERASAHDRAGRWDEAYSDYGDALRLSFRNRDPEGILRSLSSSARTLWHSDRAEAAEEVAELGVEIAQRLNARRPLARFLNLLGVIQQHRHEKWEAARVYYLRALDYARDEGYDEMIAGVCPNLGVVENSLGNLREARALYLEGIAACVRSDSALSEGIAYNNLGMVCSDLEEWMEAEIHFLRGVEIAERLGEMGLLARLLTGRAEPLIRTRDHAGARLSLDRAQKLAEELEDARSLADIERYRGMMARTENRLDEAEIHLERAHAIASGGALQLESAEALEEMAYLRREQGRKAAARAVLREAQRAFKALGAARDLARIELVAAQWANAPLPTISA